MSANTKSTRFAALDGLRGLAAICVVFFHLRGQGGALFPSGYLAVDFFFLLSGFVVCHAYEERLKAGLSVMKFMVLRLVRLWPLHVLGVCAGLLAAGYQAFHGWTGDTFTTLTEMFVANALFLPAPPGHHYNDFSAFPLNGPSWSLTFELIANLIFGYALVRWGRRGIALIAILGATALLVSVVAFHTANIGFAYDNLVGGLVRVSFGFFAGVGLYWAFNRLRPNFQAPIWLVATMVIASLAMPVSITLRPFYDLSCITLVYPLLIFLGATSQPSNRLLRACTISGSLSYALYATHLGLAHGVFNPLFHKFLGMDVHTLSVPAQIAFIAVLVAIAFALDKYFEPPVRAVLGRIFNTSSKPKTGDLAPVADS